MTVMAYVPQKITSYFLLKMSHFRQTRTQTTGKKLPQWRLNTSNYLFLDNKCNFYFDFH